MARKQKTTTLLTIEVKRSSILKKLWKQALGKDRQRHFSQNMPDLRTLLFTFSEQYLQGHMASKQKIRIMIRHRIAVIQQQIEKQLNEIIHKQALQKLEANWRGLRFLINGYNTADNIKFRVLNIGKDELLKDFEKTVDFDQSVLFKLIYEKEFGTYGGLPYSFLIGDFEFSRSNRDLYLLKNLSHVAASAHSPLIASAGAGLLDMESFMELGLPRKIDRIFDSREMVKWRSFRDSEDSRYVALTLPHILLRLPYGRSRGRLSAGELNFEEDVDAKTPNKYLWGNAAYALGQRICDSFVRYGWLVRFYGVDGKGAGKVEGLPLPQFDTLPIPKMSTDVFINSDVEKELSRQGLICLCHCKMTVDSAFFSVHTVHKVKSYRSKTASANERLSSMLPHILTASRIAHYLKVIMRDKIGKFSNREEVESHLNNWLNQYVLTQTNVTPELKAQFPLQESRVEVFEDKDYPGRFKVMAHLQPHFQLEALTAAIKLVSTLPSLRK